MQLRSPGFLNASDVAIGTQWAFSSTVAKSCLENAKDVGELIGTGYVARDMMQIVDALQEDGLLRFWGFSYGTALGATVAALFPDRMDKLVLDGVLNPRDYYAGRVAEQVTDSDASYDGFFTGCVAKPDRCVLAQNGTTAQELKAKIYELLATLKYQPIAAGSSATTDIIDYNAVKGLITASMYTPELWPLLARGLNGILTSNYTAFFEVVALQTSSSAVYPNGGFESTLGIRGSDVRPRSNDFNDAYPLVEETLVKSRIFGDYLSTPALAFLQWPFKAKGGYAGDFQDIKTRNPILFVGNRFDPFTPLVSAQNASASFVGSVVLEHGGYGVSPYVASSSVSYELTS